MASATLAATVIAPSQEALLSIWRELCEAHRAGAKATNQAAFSDRLEAVRLDDAAEAHATEALQRLAHVLIAVDGAKGGGDADR